MKQRLKERNILKLFFYLESDKGNLIFCNCEHAIYKEQVEFVLLF